MKLVKLSVVTMLIAGMASCSFAADTLADAFKNGKVSGELKVWYFDKDTEKLNSSTSPTSVLKDTAKSGDILNTTVVLNYVTDAFYGFNLGTTIQANAAPFVDEEGKEAYKDDMYGSGAVLSEAYLGYTLGKTNAKIGRQFISTPIVNGSGSRIVKESFEGATIVNTDLPAIYCQSKIFLYPSLRESFGIPMLEAMACGVPLITSNTSSMPEVAGDAAMIINPFKPGEITAAIISLYTDNSIRERLIRAGLIQAAKFSWKAMAEDVLKIYNETGK